MFSSEKFVLAVHAGAGEVEASSLLPAGRRSKGAELVGPKREEVRREERELGPKGTQVATRERNSLGGIQDSGLGTPQE